jgi:branched-chain amino acid transport system permease protein
MTERRALLAVLGVLAVAPLLATFVGEPYYVSFVTRVMIFALAAVSLDLILGFGGMVSFGHAAFFGLGAYVVAVLAHHDISGTPVLSWPIELPGTSSALISWPLAALAAGLFALATGWICLRTSGVNFIMITLAFAQMLYYVSTSVRAYGGDEGLTLWQRSTLGPLPIEDDLVFCYLVLALLTIALLGARRVVGARFGVVLTGSRDNERRTVSLGFPIFRYKLAAYVISASLCGLAGALVANQTEFVSPTFLHWARSGEILVMVILGGIGSLVGPVIGAAILLLLEEVLSDLTQHWQIVLGPILLLVVLFARRGLYGLLVREAPHG